MKKNWYKHKVFIVLLHAAVWTMLFFVPYFMRPNVPDLRTPALHEFLRWQSVLQYCILAFIFYFNAFWLIPFLLNKRRYLAYAAAVLVLLIGGLYVQISSRRPMTTMHMDRVLIREGRAERGRLPPMRQMMIRSAPPFYPALISLVFVIALSTTYRFFLDRLRFDKIRQQRETEHLKSELGFLRSQISPHFIFNVLNSAVSLARVHPEQVEPTLIKLSGLMRYMLYDTDDTKVPLSQEVEYLESYIELQQLRFGDLVEITFSKTGSFFGYAVEPMLLIPFVENAFKHGMGMVDYPSIVIDLQETGGNLWLHVKNRFKHDQSSKKDKYSGIGLANVKKRLEILYGNRFDLYVNTTGSWFEVDLKIPLQ